MNVLIFGSSSFAGKCLEARLAGAGHEVYHFNRGPAAREGRRITGSIEGLEDNPHWPERVDVIINYTLLKDQTIEENVEFCARLLALARRVGCGRLIHISSVSTYKFSRRVIDEVGEVEPDAANKGAYAALKVATENYLRTNAGDVPIVFVRPGFILGEGLVSATVGTAVKIPGGKLMILGNASDTMPLTTRAILDDCLLALVEREHVQPGENFLIVDSHSPTKREYVEYCAHRLGQGKDVWTLPVPLWLGIAGLAQGLLNVAGMSKTKVWQKFYSVSRAYRYDSARTAARLGVSLDSHWRAALDESFGQQARNYVLPRQPLPARLDSIDKVLFFGFGRIVQQKHLRALKEGGFRGTVQVYDPFLKALPGGDFPVERVEDPAQSGAALAVVATPGRNHREAIALLPAGVKTVLIEKPVGYGMEELREWEEAQRAGGFAASVFHNYRLKGNVVEMTRFLETHNSGELLRCDVTFDSPAIANDGAKWARDERRARTLLYDYGLHFLDIGVMFGEHYRGIREVAWSLNQRGETSDISGVIALSNYDTHFRLRQGQGTQRTLIEFVFANYVARLTFFPDTLTIISGRDGFVDRSVEFYQQGKATLQKVADKLSHQDADKSHPLIYQDAYASQAAGQESLTSLAQVARTYQILDDVSQIVYGK